MGTESKEKSDKEICEICGEKIGLTRAKVKEGFGDRVVCFFCLKDGKAALNCQKCGREFYPQEKSLKNPAVVSRLPGGRKQGPR